MKSRFSALLWCHHELRNLILRWRPSRKSQSRSHSKESSIEESDSSKPALTKSVSRGSHRVAVEGQRSNTIENQDALNPGGDQSCSHSKDLTPETNGGNLRKAAAEIEHSGTIEAQDALKLQRRWPARASFMGVPREIRDLVYKQLAPPDAFCIHQQSIEERPKSEIWYNGRFNAVMKLPLWLEVLDHMRREVSTIVLLGTRIRNDQFLLDMESLRETGLGKNGLRKNGHFWKTLAKWNHIEIQFDRTNHISTAMCSEVHDTAAVAAELDALMCWWDDNQTGGKCLVIQLHGLFDFWRCSHRITFVPRWKAARKQSSFLSHFRRWLVQKRMPERGRIRLVLGTWWANTLLAGNSVFQEFCAGIEDMIVVQHAQRLEIWTEGFPLPRLGFAVPFSETRPSTRLPAYGTPMNLISTDDSEIYEVRRDAVI